MALTVKAGFGNDLAELAEDLEAVEHGLSRVLSDEIGHEAQPVLAEMAGVLPYDAAHRGWRGETRRRDPGHIRKSLKAEVDRQRGLIVRTTHPGGPAHWWGGTIDLNRGYWRHGLESARDTHEVEIRKHPEAGEDFVSDKAEEVGRKVDGAVERLLARKGL